jgi:hypothetical protein
MEVPPNSLKQPKDSGNILMAEALGCTLLKARHEDHLPRIKIVQGVKHMDYPKFADNRLLMGGASYVITNKFKNILDTICKPLMEW